MALLRPLSWHRAARPDRCRHSQGRPAIPRRALLSVCCRAAAPHRTGVPPTALGGTIALDLEISGFGAVSHWRDLHFADALSPSLLKHLLKLKGGVQQNYSLADG